MTHIICRALNCLFWEDSVCTSEEIEYEPDAGCVTFQDIGDLDVDDEEEDEFDWDSEEDADLLDDDDEWDDEADDDDWDDL
jgi:hypothetical protein